MGRNVKREERLETVHAMVVSGQPRWRIYKAQRLAGVPDRTTRQDLADLAERYRGEFDDPQWAETEIAGVYERIGEIGREARERGAFRDALSAARTQASIVGVRTDRWARLGPNPSVEVKAAVTARSASDEELADFVVSLLAKAAPREEHEAPEGHRDGDDE